MMRNNGYAYVWKIMHMHICIVSYLFVVFQFNNIYLIIRRIRTSIKEKWEIRKKVDKEID